MKALIHIGTPKSGTTSIQSFLRLNQQRLIAQGFRCEPFDPTNLAQMELATVGVIRAGDTVKEANKRHALGVGDRDTQVAYVNRYEEMLREGVNKWGEETYLASGEQVPAPNALRRWISFLASSLMRCGMSSIIARRKNSCFPPIRNASNAAR